MIEQSLFLSNWDDNAPVFIPLNVVKDLRSYHLMGIRFLYNCFRKNLTGAVLNHDKGMNFQIQISALLNALRNFISPTSPVLIISPEDSLTTWHYHLVIHGEYGEIDDILILTSNDCKELLLNKSVKIILSTIDNSKLLREINGSGLFSVILDDFDKIAYKVIVKQLHGDFNIGLTSRNFFSCPDQKLFWTMLNWSNPGAVGKLADFYEEDHNHLINLRDPYNTWWQRLTWHFCESFKVPIVLEQKEYKKRLDKWSKQHLLGLSKVQLKKTKQKSSRKSRSYKRIKQEEESKDEPMVDNLHMNCISKVEVHLNDDTSKIKQEERSQNETMEDTFQGTCALIEVFSSDSEKPCNFQKDQDAVKPEDIGLIKNDSESSHGTIIYNYEDLSSCNKEYPILASVMCQSTSFIEEPREVSQIEGENSNDILLSILRQ